MTYLDLVEVVFNIVLKSFCSGWYFMPTLVFLFTTARKDDHAQVKSKDWVNDSYHMLVRSPYRSLAFFSLGHLKKKINNKIHTSITYQPKRKSDFGSMHQEFPKATKSHLDQTKWLFWSFDDTQTWSFLRLIIMAEIKSNLAESIWRYIISLKVYVAYF